MITDIEQLLDLEKTLLANYLAPTDKKTLIDMIQRLLKGDKAHTIIKVAQQCRNSKRDKLIMTAYKLLKGSLYDRAREILIIYQNLPQKKPCTSKAGCYLWSIKQNGWVMPNHKGLVVKLKQLTK